MTEKILITDDDLEIIELLRFTLENENYTVISANDGEEGFRKAKEERPDLIILDVNMPKMTGFEMCEKIRQERSTSLIPVIMLTSFGKQKDKITGIKLGADDYMNKPFEPFEVTARVEGLLRRSRESLSASPVTGLPGAVSLEAELGRRLESGESFALAAADINDFKAYNEKYGPQKGDEVLRKLGRLAGEALDAAGAPTDFVGHTGCDDFVIITAPGRLDAVLGKLLRDFDAAVPGFYDAGARERGSLTVADRRGREATFPLVSLSVGVAVAEKGTYGQASGVVERAREMLRKAKLKEGSASEIG